MESVKSLFVEIRETIKQIQNIIECGRMQNYYQFSLQETKALEGMGRILTLCAKLGWQDRIQQIQQVLLQITEAKEEEDYVLISDYYELLLLPLLGQMLESSRQEEEKAYEENYWERNSILLRERYPVLYEKLSSLQTEDILSQGKYTIEDTTSGDKTLALKTHEKRIYFHSNVSPYKEAQKLSQALYEKCNTVYHVLGLGLGYLAEALLTVDCSSKYVIYERDLNIIKLALTYRECTKWLESDRIKLVYDSDYSEFLRHLHEGNALFHEPSLHNIEKQEDFQKLYDYFMTVQSAINQRQCMKENFTCNLLHQDSSVEVLKDKIKGKTVYLIAGGPSLDKTVESLKSREKHSLIVCVGTSVKKLKAAGIHPDFMIVTDPMPWMVCQIEEQEMIPLWYLSTVFYQVRNQVNKGYLILQEGYLPAEEYGRQQGFHLYHTGGSVTTTALDILLWMECDEIICMGMDMAYTGNQTHASGTLGTRQIDGVQEKKLQCVKGVDGKNLYAPKNLNLYRKWIENRILKEKAIRLWNVSDGAYIQGMRNITTEEWLQKRTREG